MAQLTHLSEDLRRLEYANMQDEQGIRNIVREEIRRATGQSQFGFNSVPFHTHNGVDSSIAYSPVNIYTGLIQEDGTALLLPVGWTVENVSTGVYNITHNLGTDLYTMVVAPTLSVTLPIASVVGVANIAGVSWYDTLAPGFANTTFQFILVQINNGPQAVPLYTVNTA